MDEHLGYAKHDPAGRDGGNCRNGARTKSVLTDIGPVEVAIPRDRDGTFEPQIVRQRQRRLSGLDSLVISLSAKGLTHGEICAHLAEVYGASVSKQTISTITDRVIEGMSEWQTRPLDPVYPVVFIDAINVKIRDGNVANRPIYIALAVTVDGTRDVLGLCEPSPVLCALPLLGRMAQCRSGTTRTPRPGRCGWSVNTVRTTTRSGPR